MYQLLLTRRYLTSKIMPLLASLAVVLCTAMVLITWSVMGGFLKKFVASGRTMTGDVVITWPNTGFPHYQDLIDRLEADPIVAAATPVIEAFGLIQLPDGRNETVQIRGIHGPSYAQVTAYDDILWWKPLDKPVPADKKGDDPRLGLNDLMARLQQQGRTLTRINPETDEAQGAVVPGIEVSGFNQREITGFYTPKVLLKRNKDGSTTPVDVFLPRNGEVILNVLPLDLEGQAVSTVTRRLPVANEFHSGVFEFDKNIVLVELGVLQDMLMMDEALRAVEAPATPGNPADGESFAGAPPTQPTEIDPARVTHVYVRGVGDLSAFGAADALRIRCEEIYAAFAAEHPDVPPEWNIRILTWEDLNRTMINAVRTETTVVLVVFSFISLTAVFLVLAIFWAMISEKTRDIGVLRSIGASRGGIASLWLGYGLAIGIVGSILGLAAAYSIVININPIHEWMGRALGLQIWDPRVYYFVKIPNEVEPDRAAIVFFGGLFCSVAGALWPAIRAANMHPVKALRFE